MRWPKGSGLVEHVVRFLDSNPEATLTPAQVREMFSSVAGQPPAPQTVRNRLSQAVRAGQLGVLRRTRHNAPVYCRAPEPKDNGATLQAAWHGDRHGSSDPCTRLARAA